MVKDIDPKLKLLSSYLSLSANENFSIPEYQRSYSWTIDQCDKLWQDIERYTASRCDDPYFFGTIIADCSEPGKLNLIDGQQRTTSFILLLKALLIRINEKLDKMIVNDETAGLKAGLEGSRIVILKILYKLDDEDLPAFMKNSHPYVKTIIDNKSINELYKEELHKILAADTFEQAEFFAYKIPRKKKNKYTPFFKNFKYFYEKMNQMGETHINEFAKVILKKCQVIEIRSWNVEQAIVMFNSLNSTGLPLTDADIISADLYSKFNDDEKKKSFSESWQNIISIGEDLKLRKITNVDEILYQYMYIKRALLNESETTLPSMRSYFKDSHPEFLKEPESFVKDLTHILELWIQDEKDYFCVLRNIMSRLNSNFKLFYIPYMFLKENDDFLTKAAFCNALLKIFVLLEIVEAGYSSKNFKAFLFTVNMDIGQGVETEKIIGKIYSHITHNFNADKIKETLQDIFASGALVALNEVLFASSRKTGYGFLFNKAVNIEHIMPDCGKYSETIRKDAEVEEDEFNSYVDKLGNKILLEEQINKSIGRDWFVYKKRKYNNSVFPIAKELSINPNNVWTKSRIDENNDAAVERICNFVFSEDVLYKPESVTSDNNSEQG